MMWSRIWSWAMPRGKKASARHANYAAKLTIETLEDRVVPSTTSSLYDQFRQQTFRVDDVAVANVSSVPTVQAAVPTNASFGSLIGLPSAFTNTSYRGTGYSVVVIDTGIDYNNVNLGAGFGAGKRVVAGWDFVNNDADPMDDNGHGTHVAGIIGSSSTTYSGVAPNVNLIALKVLDAAGSGTFGNVENALNWVIANRAKYNIVAINLSLGAGNYTVNPYTFLDEEFSSLKNNGVFLSVAAGNSFYTNNSAIGLDFPAVDPLVVSVGAVYAGDFGNVAWGSGARDNTTAADRVASFSQRGPALSIMAPGAIITSTYLNNTFKAMAGTSMAAPVVAGAAVLIHQAMDAMHLTANEDTILALMKKTGVNVVDGDDENDNVTNTGLTFKRLDVGAALASLGQPGNSAPVVQAISSQQIAPGASLKLTLSATDPNGDAITWSASVVGSSASQAYQLKQQLGLTYPGSYYFNNNGQNEKWMSSTGVDWYCILPNGELRRWAGTMAATLQGGALVATLDARFYADPSLVWNAQPSTAPTPTVTIVGNQLTVQPPAGATGNYQIQVTASDGKATATQTFTLTIKQNNTAPQVGALASVSMLTNRSQTITLNATDAQNDPLIWSAKLVGTFATAPASLVVTGNQLTIYTSPDYVGAFDVQVTASDGSLSSSTLLRVNVAASPVANRFKGDFNRDGIQDTAFFNQDGSWWVSLNKANGSFVNQNWVTWNASSNWSQAQIGDFNGDGKTDILGIYKDGSFYVGVSSGTAFTTQLWRKWDVASNWALLQVGDFNGDGKTDILGFYKDGSIYVALSTGASFTTQYWAKWDPASTWPTFYTADVNGDGKLDFVGRYKNGDWYVAYSTGVRFDTKNWLSATAPANKTSVKA